MCAKSDMWQGRVCLGLERSRLWLELGCVIGDGGHGRITEGLECQGNMSFYIQVRILCSVLSLLLGVRQGAEGSCLKGGAVLSLDCQMSEEVPISTPPFLPCLSTQPDDNKRMRGTSSLGCEGLHSVEGLC